MTTKYLNAKRQRTWSQCRGRADPKGGRANEVIASTTWVNILQPVLLRFINPHRSPFLNLEYSSVVQCLPSSREFLSSVHSMGVGQERWYLVLNTLMSV